MVFNLVWVDNVRSNSLIRLFFYAWNDHDYISRNRSYEASIDYNYLRGTQLVAEFLNGASSNLEIHVWSKSMGWPAELKYRHHYTDCHSSLSWYPISSLRWLFFFSPPSNLIYGYSESFLCAPTGSLISHGNHGHWPSWNGCPSGYRDFNYSLDWARNTLRVEGWSSQDRRQGDMVLVSRHG